MKIGIILAAGEGTRMGIRGANKTTVLFEGKPLIQYGVDLFKSCVDQIYIVVGAHKESVTRIVAHEPKVHLVEQTERKGTGHALIEALKQIKRDRLEPEMVLVGYGDHMMFYTKSILEDLMDLHLRDRAVVTLISTKYDDPDYIAWGRIVRDRDGQLVKIVEQKEATPEERMIKESNAGFYCINFKFGCDSIEAVLNANKQGEYYVNDFTEIAIKSKLRVAVLEVPFERVGMGINSHDQLDLSSRYYREVTTTA